MWTGRCGEGSLPLSGRPCTPQTQRLCRFFCRLGATSITHLLGTARQRYMLRWSGAMWRSQVYCWRPGPSRTYRTACSKHRSSTRCRRVSRLALRCWSNTTVMWSCLVGSMDWAPPRSPWPSYRRIWRSPRCCCWLGHDSTTRPSTTPIPSLSTTRPWRTP